MNALWVRLTIAFTAATLVSIAVVALVANSQVSTDFRQFYMHTQVQQSGLMEQLGQYYGRNGGWKGVESAFAGAGAGQGQGMGQGMGMMYGAPGYVLLDDSRSTVYSTGNGGNSTPPTQAELNDALPITWQGQTVGYLVVNSPGRNDMGMSAPAEQFLAQVNT